MVLDLSLGRIAQPYLGENEYHSFVEMPLPASRAISSFQALRESPRVAARFLGEGWVFLPMNAFGKSTRIFFLDFKDEFTPRIRNREYGS